jgi:hypothetical protein
MPADSFRAQQIAMIEAAADAGPESDEFAKLLDKCDLSHAFKNIVSALIELRIDSFKKEQCPLQAIHNRALRDYFRKGNVEDQGREVTGVFDEDKLGYLNEACETSGAIPSEKTPGVTRFGRGGDELRDSELFGLGDLVTRVPMEFRDGATNVKWQELGVLAGLDNWELIVLSHKLKGVGRDKALQSYHHSDRRALQAAWKRFERTGLRKMRSILVPN